MRAASSQSIALLLFVTPLVSHADTITIDGQPYDDVLVNESSVFYYVSLPSEGTVLNVLKSDVDPASVSRTEDAEARAAIRNRWKSARAERVQESTVLIELRADSSAGDLAAVTATLEESQNPPARELEHHTDPDQGPPVFYLKGNRKVDPARRAEIRSNVARMRQAGTSASAADEGGIGFGFGPTGGGSGGGGRGGGGGSGGAGGDSRETFGNVSDLFGTIDDRSVGERPSPFN